MGWGAFEEVILGIRISSKFMMFLCLPFMIFSPKETAPVFFVLFIVYIISREICKQYNVIDRHQ
jgi:hypothetical protein